MKADWLSIGRFSLRLSFIFGRYVLDQSSSKKIDISSCSPRANRYIVFAWRRSPNSDEWERESARKGIGRLIKLDFLAEY